MTPSVEQLIKIGEFENGESTIIRKAYDFAKKAHQGQKRYSGEPYFNHVYATAKILCELGMDNVSVAAGLLHDVVEDTPVTDKDLAENFSPEICFLVDGVTKLGEVRFRGSRRHIESLRKLFVATSEDIRVLIIKLADRLHNMRTLKYVSEKKQKRIARETMEVYAPVAHRLNMGQIKGELEDLSFPYLYPEIYHDVLEMAKDHYAKSEHTLRNIDNKLKEELKKNKIKLISSDYRRKHLWSLYLKLKRKDMDISRVYDISALRVIVPETSDCYKVLGIIHSIWRPLPGRIKDYIAFPKPNGYQSIHTTIFSGTGNLAEIQIRTSKMHSEAEFGIASHYHYKGSKTASSWSQDILNRLLNNKPGTTKVVEAKTPAWIDEVVSGQTDESQPEDFMSNLTEDFFSNRIFVFTPKGDVIDLPTGSTSIDFAYHVHTKIGDHLTGAKINGKLSSLDTTLENGDIVDILTGKKLTPTAKWLEMVATTHAKRRIKIALNDKQS